MYSIPKIKAHNEQMTKFYAQQIQETVDNTTIYNDQPIFSVPSSSTYPQLCFTPTDTATAISHSNWQTEKTAALNFADYLEAGGGYLRGKLAGQRRLGGSVPPRLHGHSRVLPGGGAGDHAF